MNLSAGEARARFVEARVGRLATADAKGLPHVVPMTFAVEGDVIYSVVDHKPKRSTDLRRLRNIAENPNVAVIVDHYSDDWSALWWVRADGWAEVRDGGDGDEGADGERLRAVELLQRKYRQYVETPPTGPVVAIHVHDWRGWAALG